VVKPTLLRGFNYKSMSWADVPHTELAELIAPPLVPTDGADRAETMTTA
jgi:hypothetical protein